MADHVEEVTAYIREELWRLHQPPGEEEVAWRKVASLFGQKHHVTVHNVAKGKSQVGASFETRFAKRYFDGSVDKLRAAAHEKAIARDHASNLRRHLTKRGRRYNAATRRYAEALAELWTADRLEDEWRRELEAFERAHTTAAVKAPDSSGVRVKRAGEKAG
jgi:hypothetical protein